MSKQNPFPDGNPYAILDLKIDAKDNEIRPAFGAAMQNYYDGKPGRDALKKAYPQAPGMSDFDYDKYINDEVLKRTELVRKAYEFLRVPENRKLWEEWVLNSGNGPNAGKTNDPKDDGAGKTYKGDAKGLKGWIDLTVPTGLSEEDAILNWAFINNEMDWYEGLRDIQKRALLNMVKTQKGFLGPESDAFKKQQPGANPGDATSAGNTQNADDVDNADNINDADDLAEMTDELKNAKGPKPAKLRRPPNQKGKTGIDLPAFYTGIDYIKLWARREFNPSSWYFWFGMTRWVFPLAATRIRSDGTVRPVIKAVDDFMEAKGITSGLHELQNNILNALDKKQSISDVSKLIDSFSTKNGVQLQEFKTGIAELRSHIDAKFGIHKDSNKADLRFGLTQGQKAELLHYLGKMEHLADDLAKGSLGENGQEMVKVATGIKNQITVTMNDFEQRIADTKLTTKLIAISANGLSHANFLANNATIRKTGTWGQDNRKANYQWVKGLERALDIQASDFFRPMNGIYLPYENFQKENLEHTIMNDILSYADRDDKGALVKVMNTDKHVSDFCEYFKRLADRGFGHEAFEAVDALIRLRQPMITKRLGKFEAGNDIDPLPSKDSLIKGFKDVSGDHDYSTLANQLAAKAQAVPPGRHRQITLGRDFLGKDTRTGRADAYANMYMKLYTFRWKGTNLWAAPGDIAKNTFLKNSLDHFTAHLTGAYKHKNGTTLRFGSKIKNTTVDITPLDKDEKGSARWRRAALRIFSAGIIDDLNWKKPHKIIASPADIAMVSTSLMLLGGTMWGAGAATHQGWLDATGKHILNHGTIPVNTVLGNAGRLTLHSVGVLPNPQYSIHGLHIKFDGSRAEVVSNEHSKTLPKTEKSGSSSSTSTAFSDAASSSAGNSSMSSSFTSVAEQNFQKAQALALESNEKLPQPGSGKFVPLTQQFYCVLEDSQFQKALNYYQNGNDQEAYNITIPACKAAGYSKDEIVPQGMDLSAQ